MRDNSEIMEFSIFCSKHSEIIPLRRKIFTHVLRAERVQRGSTLWLPPRGSQLTSRRRVWPWAVSTCCHPPQIGGDKYFAKLCVLQFPWLLFIVGLIWQKLQLRLLVVQHVHSVSPTVNLCFVHDRLVPLYFWVLPSGHRCAYSILYSVSQV